MCQEPAQSEQLTGSCVMDCTIDLKKGWWRGLPISLSLYLTFERGIAEGTRVPKTGPRRDRTLRGSSGAGVGSG
jgi:hypothetical protein